jgi:phage pi2 protein 07
MQEDNVKNDLKEIRCENVDWVHLTEDKVQWWVFMRARKISKSDY